MREKQWHKFPVLFSLYIAQSIPMSFFSTVVPVIMRQQNYSLESIGLLQLIKLPWILKFLWAPMIDRKANSLKKLRGWIIGSELFYAAIILGIGLFNLETDFHLIVGLMVIAFVASATQDIATDAYAIFMLKPAERSLGNSMQSGGSFVGTLFGTGVLLITYYYFGWSLLLILLAAFVLFAIVPLLLHRPEVNIDKTSKSSVNFGDIISFFKIKGMGKRVLMLIFYYSGFVGILGMIKPYMVDLGYTIEEIGFYSGIIGTCLALAGALIAGLIIRKKGRRWSAMAFVLAGTVTTFYFLMLSMSVPHTSALIAGLCMLWFSYGLSTVLIYTISMDVVRPGREGTDFTVQIVITHLSSLLIVIMSGRIGDLLGYQGLFAIEVLLCLVAVLIVYFLYSKKKSNESIGVTHQ
jgi:MFS family permease